MSNLLEISILLVRTVFDHLSTILTSLSDVGLLLTAGSGATLAFALGMVSPFGITEGVLAGIRRWHGSIDEQFSNIDNLVSVVTSHQPRCY
ncbi:MAG: hypothetical protein LBD59_08575 [Prevotellaceae bacterium]|jgi:hypothetical protein|nr:hypothetical protein [Prevotellaceae bacterium]